MRASLALLPLAVTISAPLFAQAAEGTTPGAPAPEDENKLICKREVPVGSLIASRKVCLTKRQWAERERVGNDVARQMIQDNQGRPTSN
jgi:hypothetical protein